MSRTAVFIASLACAGLGAGPVAGAGFTATEMMKLLRLSDPQLSPDGASVLYTATEVDLAGNARNNDLWLVPLSGGEPRRLTSHPRSDTRGRWSPDGGRVAFVSSREGAPQVYLLELRGGEARKLTSLAAGVNAVSWIDGSRLLVAADVHPACAPGQTASGTSFHDEACNKRKVEEEGKPSSARAYDRLLFRHWDAWEDHRRSHLLVVPIEGGDIRDLTPGDRDVPPFSLGGPDDFAVSPDGREVAFVRNDDAVEALSTNAELFVVPTTGGFPRKVSGQPGYDGGPRYSPDGAQIAFRAQLRAGYESDRWRLMVYDRKAETVRTLTESLDRHVEGFAWSPDSKSLYFTAGDNAIQPIYTVPAAGGAVRLLVRSHTLDEVQVTPDGRTLVATEAALTHPVEIVRFAVDGTDRRPVTRANDARLGPFRLRDGESVTYKGAAGKDVQAWIVKPPDFDPARRYPLLVLIHGGPQGVWGDGWTFRWNAQVFASAGYVVFMPNPRGSTGWGQEFVDDINGDWGGRAYEDVMKGTDYAVALPYVDPARTGAAGASYGGYMVDWIAGHTDRFKALVSHDGVYDLESMYGSTEELWFVEWEFGGPPWMKGRPEVYRRWSPSQYAQNFKTPTLVIHGEQDFRVPIEQGMAFFSALQRLGVPSRLLVFPDENHFVLKPANSVRWYDEVISWLGRWVRP